MNRIKELFSNDSKKLIVFITAGFPKKDSTKDLVLEAIKGGADMIEIGIPFSDPQADGPVIQEANEIALNNGISLLEIFEQVKEIRKQTDVPIALMGYYNPILKMGTMDFIKKCNEIGINGLIIVDFPYPQNFEFAKKCKESNITFIQLLSPTTNEDRMKKVINDSDMIYYISMLSTTGGMLKVAPKKILQNYNTIKRINPKKNLVIGFGITEKTISSLKSANGLVVGSMLCKIITKSLKMRQNPVTKLAKVVYNLKNKIL